MRRHGWTFCLGLMVAGSAVAQPPASAERYPPAPEMPGVVVGESPRKAPASGRPAVRQAQAIAAETPAPNLPSPMPSPVPTSGPVTATMAMPVAEGCAPSVPCGPRVSMHHRDLQTWCKFQSQSRQSGHYVTPYRPALQAWFPCTPTRGNCATGACAAPHQVIPTLPAGPDTPQGFKKVAEGVSFTAGSAPMADPTTQTAVKSKWRPK